MPTVRIEPNYKVTIPKEARDSLRLKVGDVVEATISDKEVILRRKASVATPSEVRELERARREHERGEYIPLEQYLHALGSTARKARAKKS
jgi:AbrB family looped-hinge helix DNA binding protein